MLFSVTQLIGYEASEIVGGRLLDYHCPVDAETAKSCHTEGKYNRKISQITIPASISRINYAIQLNNSWRFAGLLF